MNLKFNQKKITGLLTILPQIEIKFEDELENYNFSKAQSLKLKMVMGYDKHRIVDEKTCISDLAVFGMNYLFENKLLSKNDVDAIVVVTQSPDFLMPPTSVIIQGQLGLKNDMYCLDINQGCAGYIVGLHQAFMLLDQEKINKVALINADILSKKVNRRDRNSFPLIGDAASITIVEKDNDAKPIFGNIKFNGAAWDTLMIPAGGFRLPSSPETSIAVDDGKGNFRSPDNLVMKGDAVFNFVQTEVPPMIDALTNFANCPISEIDYFMFHQPNKFMLQKLADKMKVEYHKMPFNIVENFGNASGVTIPTAITYNLGEKLVENEFTICLAGFGVGLTWGSLLLETGKFNFCNAIYY